MSTKTGIPGFVLRFIYLISSHVTPTSLNSFLEKSLFGIKMPKALSIVDRSGSSMSKNIYLFPSSSSIFHFFKASSINLTNVVTF